jgi:hypothetical protein
MYRALDYTVYWTSDNKIILASCMNYMGEGGQILYVFDGRNGEGKDISC